MFQVAAHPTAFDAHRQHGHGHSHAHPSARRSSHHQSSSSSQGLQLPRTLARPPFAECSREAILAASPELANVPSEFIRLRLRETAPQMLAGMSCLAPSHMPAQLPRTHIPSAMNVPVRASSSSRMVPSYPTHVLAIAPSKHASHSSDAVALFPVHALVLASHCALLPRLPSAAPAHPTATQVQLPVMPLQLPSLTAFKILHSFMYTHNVGALLAALLPLPEAFTHTSGFSGEHVTHTMRSGTKLHELSSYLYSASHKSLSSLTTHAAHVKELWQDCVTLGVYDLELWDAMDLAWEIVLGAMNIAAAAH
ncbi:hypothetical protein HGRIS_012280 [Hohenbuehelia grisea]|uniref:BTB domain-containing protein n=1 Tax=Hohenbuehelia grisea TaxID=104357 RepID=A0ABR3IRV6_9AGAR